jgi:hypothetical protein
MRSSTKRLLSALLSLIFLLLALIFFIYFIKPLYSDIESLRSKLLSKQSLINNQKSLIDQFKNLNQDYESQKKNQEIFSLILPQSISVGEALVQISGLLTSNNLNLLSFNVNKPNLLSNNQSSKSTSTSFIKPLGIFDINLKATGDYSNFKNFLNQLETNIRLFDIKTLTINQTLNIDSKNQNKNLLMYDITISTYYQGE